MRVGIDATSWANRRGFGRFARNVIGRLVELDGETTYVFVADAAAADGLDLPAGVERRAVRLRHSSPEGPNAGASRHPVDLLRLGRAASRSDLDAFVFPSVYSYFPVLGVPTILGLHDATAETHPELLFPTRRERIAWRAKQATALRLAKGFFAVSEAARTAVAGQLGLDAERIPVIGEAPDPVFSQRPREASIAAAEAIGLAADEPYIVYAAGISPHKNVETLLDAVPQLPPALKLVLAGDLDGDPYLSAAPAIKAKIAELGIAERVVLPGFLSDDALAALYSRAVAAVVPSLSEGFGLPAVEAAACGAAVVLSDLPAHRETLGGAALFFEPRDATALAAHVTSLHENDELRRSSAAAARAAAGRLNWDASAERLREAIVRVARRPRD